MKKLLLTLMLVSAFALPARAASHEEQRAEIQKMEATTLSRLYKIEPDARRQISKAAGYAVFSTADLAAFFFSGSYGHGIAHENNGGNDTYMQMASAGVGLGLGVKDFNVVFIFDNSKTFNDFVTTGLDLSGNLDLAAKQGVKGGAVTASQHVLPGVKVYQMTKTGLMGQIMLKGTKYWRDAALNEEKSSRLEPSRTDIYNR